MNIGGAGIRRIAVLAGVLACTCIAGSALTSLGASDAEAGFCLAVSDALLPLLPVSEAIGRFGGSLLWIAASLILIAVRRTRPVGLALLASTVAVLIAGDVAVKNIVQRPRPFVVLDVDPLVPISTRFSYPSVHTASAFGALAVLGCRWRRAAPALLAFGVVAGASRIAVLAHFPTDVAAGAALGLAIGLFIAKAMERTDLRRDPGRP